MTDDFSDAIAVKIASTALKEQGNLFDDSLPELWFSFSEKFDPKDGLPVYFPSELPILAEKTVEQLKEINRTKTTFPGSRVRE